MPPWPITRERGTTPPTAFGKNFCGTLDDYANGLTYPPAGPPVQYDANGMPTCCPGSGPPVPQGGYIVQEDGFRILQEDGSSILQE